MREVALFVEDDAHRRVVGALLRRLADESGLTVRLDWRSAVRGHGRVVQEFRRYLSDLATQGGHPDLIVVATDANCSGLQRRIKDIDASAAVFITLDGKGARLFSNRTRDRIGQPMAVVYIEHKSFTELVDGVRQRMRM